MMPMSSLDSVAIDPDLIRRLTRREYHALYRAGLFEDERVELLYGQLVAMSPTDPSHDRSVTELARILYARVGHRADVRVQCAFAPSDTSESIPDLVVAPAQTASWREHPSEALLVIEVARTSLRKDREVKARLYAQGAVAEYWIVDIDGRCVHVFRDADHRGSWRAHRVARRGETLAVAALPDVTIAVDDILPPVT